MERGKAKSREIVAFVGFAACFLADYFFQPLHEDQILFTALILVVLYIIFSAYVEHHDARNKEVKPLGPVAFRLALAILLFPIILFANGALDYSAPLEKQSVVIEKQIRSGRGGSSTHYLKIEPWDPNDDYLTIKVPGYIYGQAREDSPVAVQLHKGFFAIPWVGNIRFLPASR